MKIYDAQSFRFQHEYAPNAKCAYTTYEQVTNVFDQCHALAVYASGDTKFALLPTREVRVNPFVFFL
jgi:hypothetical protein